MKSDFFFENFKLLVDAPNSIPKLRKTILQLAVKGKLVKQYSNEEPASILLKKIKSEKEKLVKDGKIKKQMVLLQIAEKEIPYKLPVGWEWVRIDDITTVNGGKRVPKGASLQVIPTSHIYIRVTDMKDSTILDNDLHYISEEVYQTIKKYIISSEDLYITIAGTIGQVGEVPELFSGMNLTENAARITPYHVSKSFLKHLLNSKLCQGQFLKKINQMAQPKLALHRIKSTIISLPPLAEQHRIVSKIDKLNSICDKLESKKNQSIEIYEYLASIRFFPFLTAL